MAKKIHSVEKTVKSYSYFRALISRTRIVAVDRACSARMMRSRGFELRLLRRRGFS